MSVPPDQMDNMHKAIAQFTIPKSFLDRKPRVFVVMKDETKATVHSMPDIVVGFTDFLDIQFKQLLASPTQDRDVFEVTYDPKTASADILKCKTDLEMGIHSFSGVNDFEENK